MDENEQNQQVTDPEERIDGPADENGDNGMQADDPNDVREFSEEAPEAAADEVEPRPAVEAAEAVEETKPKDTSLRRRVRVAAGLPAPAKVKSERKAKAAPKAKREAKPKAEKKLSTKRGPSLAHYVTNHLINSTDPVSIADIEKAVFSAIPKATALRGYETDTLAKTNYANRRAGKKEITAIPESNETPESKRVEFGRRGILNRTLTAMRNNGTLVRVKGVGKDSIWKLSAGARKTIEMGGGA